MEYTVDTCLVGAGIICGAEVRVRNDCSVQVNAGTIVLQSGRIIHLQDIRFRYYKRRQFVDPATLKAVLSYLKLGSIDDNHPEYMELSEENADPATVDSLKQQHPEDIPEHNLLMNRIMAICVFEHGENEVKLFFLLLSRDAIAASMKIKPDAGNTASGLFTKAITRKDVDPLTIDGFLRPYTQLPRVFIPRLGYKRLAIVDVSKGLEEHNLQNPYTNLRLFKQLFFEYKEIIDDHVPVLQKALGKLHRYFGPLLSHKGDAYLEKFRKLLLAKVHRFYEEGEHLYYIQYFYDWLVDLNKAYEELCLILDGFFAGCSCNMEEDKANSNFSIVLLGPVLGGMSTYHPLIFRDLSGAALSDEQIRKVRMLHWRLLMMIWTFDLPFLRLDKVLRRLGFEPAIEEELDSTNYWEFLSTSANGGETNDIPIKLTPTVEPWKSLAEQAIPYYYPLDSNSMYSLHQFWNYTFTRRRITDQLLSYNAHEGDPQKPSTNVSNDSYTDRKEMIMPLAFDLLNYPYLKPEGHIGKSIVPNSMDSPTAFQFTTFPMQEYLEKYNLAIDVIAIGLTDIKEPVLQLLNGLEHKTSIRQGETLVLLYVATDNEQIELEECNKDDKPEIGFNTIVADFILPYRYSCCSIPEVNALTLTRKILT